MTEKFKELTAFIDSIETRKRAAMTEVDTLRGLLAKTEGEYERAAIVGAPTAEISLRVDKLQKDLEQARKRASTLTQDPKTVINVIKGNTDISSLAAEIVSDNAVAIEALRGEFNERLGRLSEVKAEYLRIVSELGALNAQSASLAREQRNVKEYIPGLETAFFGSVCGDERGPEAIYTDVEIRSAYKAAK